MPKLIIVQGPRDDEEFAKICRENNACGGSLHALIEKHKFTYSVGYIYMIARKVCRAYMSGLANIAVHGNFLSNKDAAFFVLDADVRGYDAKFVRLPDAEGEELSWKECFSS